MTASCYSRCYSTIHSGLRPTGIVLRIRSHDSVPMTLPEFSLYQLYLSTRTGSTPGTVPVRHTVQEVDESDLSNDRCQDTRSHAGHNKISIFDRQQQKQHQKKVLASHKLINRS
jgi:hypothetical protein